MEFKEKKATAEGMNVFMELTDLGIQSVLREVDSEQLAVALKNVSAGVRDDIMRNLSRRAAASIRDEIDFIGPIKVSDIESTQFKILEVIERKEEAGEIVRRTDDPPASTENDQLSDLKSLIENKGVSDRFSEELVEILVCLGMKSRRDGILSLENALPLLDDDFLTHGLMLAIDGTDPRLIKEILGTKKGALVSELEKRIEMLLTGIMAIQKGDNPRIVEQKCKAFLPTPWGK